MKTSVKKDFKLFGSRRRTQVLEVLALLGESYPQEIARFLQARLFSIQQIVDALELEGVIVTRRSGVERRVSLNPRFFATSELNALLRKLALNDPQILDAVAAKRVRPRRRGKL